jgi:Flp pilus assembly protein TadG
MACSLSSTICRALSSTMNWLGCRKGNVALLFAVLAPVAVGGAGLATEVGVWYHRRLQLQAAADSAAYAGAVELRAGGNLTTVTAEALSAAEASGYDNSQGTLTVNNPPQSGTHETNQAVEVLISENVPRFFSALFINTPLVEHTRSVTTFQTASNACVLALDTSASGAVSFAGSSSVSLTGCSVMANSLSSSAVSSQGAASLSADCIIAVGGVSLTSGATETVCSSPITQAPPVADPFADVPTPSVPSGGCASTSGSILYPGTYCSGLSLKGNVTLSPVDKNGNPGVYYMEGELKINANANVTGNGVTIYMSGTSDVSMNGNATVNISAPTTGTYSGILFFGDRSTSGVSETVNGTADSTMTGAIYFATQNVSYIGNFSGANGCTQVVADTISWSGHSHLAANCTGYGMKTLQAYEAVRFVE